MKTVNLNDMIFKHSCLNLMDTNEKNIWSALADEFSPLLNKILVADVAFTPHDYDRHCHNIFKVISEDILKNGTSLELSSNDLLVLNASVLLHDISMTEIDTDRSKHARVSADLLRELRRKNTYPSLKLVSGIQFNYICKLIEAHSDWEIDSSNKKIFSLNKFPTINDLDKKMKFLAGILRLADELDVTSDRFDSQSFNKLERAINNLEESSNNSDDDIKKLASYRESRNHWIKCRYVRNIQREDNAVDTLQIVLEDEDLLVCDDLENILPKLIEMENKINDEFNKIHTEVFNTSSMFGNVCKPLAKIRLKSSDENILDRIKSIKANQVIAGNQNNSDELDHERIVVPSEKPTVICIDLNKEITRVIKEENLIKSGHTKLNDKYCIKDSLQLSEIFKNHQLFVKIKDKLVDHLRNDLNDQSLRMDEDIIALVGLDFFGMSLAAAISLDMNIPYSFIVPFHKENEHAEYDIDIHLPENCKKIIIFCDIVASGRTVTLAANKLIETKNISEILSIYSVLFRPSSDDLFEHHRNTKYFTLNNEFPVDIISQDNCKTRPCIGCLAANNIIY